MLEPILVAFLVVVIIRFATILNRNVKIAKASGLPYLISPFNFIGFFWPAISGLVVPVLKLIPSSRVRLWAKVIDKDWFYKYRHDFYKEMGNDTILVAHPGGLYMTTSDAKVIQELCARRANFPKPIFVYQGLELFGRNLITTENENWQRHRKVAAPAFSEELNSTVWEDSIRQTEALIKNWTGRPSNTPGRMMVSTVPEDIATLTLHNISKAGFGVELYWPNERHTEATGLSRMVPSEGMTFTFKAALHTMLRSIMLLIIFPKWVLKNLPIKGFNDAENSFEDCKVYFEQLRDEQLQKAREGSIEGPLNLMSRLIKAAVNEQAFAKEGKPSGLSDEELTGNFFVMLFAGHETTSSSIFYTLVLLAANRKSQAAAQKNVDEIFGDKEPSQWSYKDNIMELSNGMLQACILEQHRYQPSVPAFPKSCENGSQTIQIDGHQVFLPENTFIHITAYSAHRNPKYWKHQPSKKTGAATDLEDYVPERWILTDAENKAGQSGEGSPEPKAASSNRIYEPPPGAFVAFSSGPRRCIGRRFAQVEMLVVLAIILQTYTVELSVEEWASEEAIRGMSADEKKLIYQKAVDKAEHTLKYDCEMTITLKLKPGKKIPLRFCKRGEELFSP